MITKKQIYIGLIIIVLICSAIFLEGHIAKQEEINLKPEFLSINNPPKIDSDKIISGTQSIDIFLKNK